MQRGGSMCAINLFRKHWKSIHVCYWCRGVADKVLRWCICKKLLCICLLNWAEKNITYHWKCPCILLNSFICTGVSLRTLKNTSRNACSKITFRDAGIKNIYIWDIWEGHGWCALLCFFNLLLLILTSPFAIRNELCGGIVKPNIVFFGESLPARFWQLKVKGMRAECECKV